MKNYSIGRNQAYSIYNYHALETILKRSRKFVLRSEEQHEFRTHAVAEAFVPTLYYDLFGARLRAREQQLIHAVLGTLEQEAERMLASPYLEEYKVEYLAVVLDLCAATL